MYYCELGDRVVVGSSPEALVKLNGRRATMRPIAGTRPRGADAAADAALEAELLADPKENSEHVMLVTSRATTWAASPPRARCTSSRTVPSSATAT